MTRDLYKGCLSLSVTHRLPVCLPYIYLDVGCIYLTYVAQNWNSIRILAVASSLQKGKTNLKILLKIIQEFVKDCFFIFLFFFFCFNRKNRTRWLPGLYRDYSRYGNYTISLPHILIKELHSQDFILGLAPVSLLLSWEWLSSPLRDFITNYHKNQVLIPLSWEMKASAHLVFVGNSPSPRQYFLSLPSHGRGGKGISLCLSYRGTNAIHPE